MKKVVGVVFLSLLLVLSACGNETEEVVSDGVDEADIASESVGEESQKSLAEMTEQEIIEVAQSLLLSVAENIWSEQETFNEENLLNEFYTEDAVINPQLDSYYQYNDLNTYDVTHTYTNEAVEVNESTFYYTATRIESLQNDLKTVELSHTVAITVSFDAELNIFKINEQYVEQDNVNVTYARDQLIEWSDWQLENLSEEILTMVQNALNESGDIQKDTISFVGLQSVDTGEDNKLMLDVFIRNGFEYAVSNLNGDVEVIVQEVTIDEDGNEQINDITIAKADFKLAEVGQIPAGSTVTWSLIYNEEFIFVDDIQQYNLNESGFLLKSNINYNY